MPYSKIPNSKVISDLLSYLDSNEKKISNTVLNHKFFNSVFYGGASKNTRSQVELTLLSESANLLTNNLISNIEVASNDFVFTNDLQTDKVLLSNVLIGLVNTFKTGVFAEAGLDFIEANVLLANAEFQIQTIPSLVDLAVTIGIEAGEGQMNGRIAGWSKFWKIVAVVVVSAIAAAVIGGAVVGLIAYINQVAIGATMAAAAAAAGAAAAIGAYIGLGVGAVVGAIEGSLGNCPANGWFDTSVPLIDWEENCF